MYCNPPAAWVNNFTELLLGGNWIAGRRWVQSVTESYRLVMEVQPSVAATGPIVGRQRASFEIESDRASAGKATPSRAATQAIAMKRTTAGDWLR
ncbi:hypothetical protein CSC36_0004 [Pseudomonas aeruginosa]|nr:hypothetical protein CSC36_0004 [Pseudomonas aeruginosa]